MKRGLIAWISVLTLAVVGSALAQEDSQDSPAIRRESDAPANVRSKRFDEKRKAAEAKKAQIRWDASPTGKLFAELQRHEIATNAALEIQEFKPRDVFAKKDASYYRGRRWVPATRDVYSHTVQDMTYRIREDLQAKEFYEALDPSEHLKCYEAQAAAIQSLLQSDRGRYLNLMKNRLEIRSFTLNLKIYERADYFKDQKTSFVIDEQNELRIEAASLVNETGSGCKVRSYASLKQDIESLVQDLGEAQAPMTVESAPEEASGGVSAR